MAHIYKIISPKGKIYVGSSVDINARFKKYKRGHCEGQKRLYASFLKYGIDAHKFEIITECVESEMYKVEAVYGHMYDVLGKNGLNCLLPKHGDNYISKSQEIIDKISKANKGKGPSKEAIEKARIANTGRAPWNKGTKMSDASKEKFTMKGKTHSEETKQKMRDSHKGPRENRRGIKLKFAKRVLSEETKKKKAEQLKQFWANKKNNA